ncbi:TPA: hypothetical protein ACH3X2_004551 [Trebouxia sp. C0005]
MVSLTGSRDSSVAPDCFAIAQREMLKRTFLSQAARSQAELRALQVSEASALERAAAAERSNAQLTEEAQDQQRTRDLAENQAEEQRDNVKQQWATAQAEWSKSLEQAQLSHDSLMQSLQRQLHDALEGRTAAEGQLKGQLAGEQEARRAVTMDLAGAQKDMEEVMQHNCELQRANAVIGDEARQMQVEQLEMMARFEAQSAELTSVKAELAAQAAGSRQAVGDLQEQVGRLQEQVARAQDAPSPAQEEAAARLQNEMDVLQQQLSTEHDLVVKTQVTLATTQEEGQKLLQRAETAEGQVHHLQDHNLSLSTNLADIRQQLPALQKHLESAAGGEQSAVATAEGLRGRVETLQGAAAEVKCQLEQQSTQLSSQVAELGSTRLKLQESQAACKALEKVQGRVERLDRDLQAAIAARQLAEDNLEDITKKLATSDKLCKAVTKKKEASSSRKAELQQQKSDLEEQVQGLDEQLEAALTQLKEETGQRCYLDDLVELLKAQLESAGLQPACVEQADDNHDALSLPEVDTTETQGEKEDDEVMSPLGSALGSPQIGAGWGHLTAGASGSSDVEQSREMCSEGAFGMEQAASSADAGSIAHGGDGGVQEDGWEEVKRATSKSKQVEARS